MEAITTPITMRQLGPCFAAEGEGVDVTKPLSPEQVDATHAGMDRYGHLMPQLHQVEAQKLDRLVFGDQAAKPARQLSAVRIGRPPRGSKTGAARAQHAKGHAEVG